MDTLILFPEYEQTKLAVEKLRTELSMLMLERDELLFVTCKNIEMQYMLKVGGLEYKAYEAQCAMLRAKRKCELLQARRNRQEEVDMVGIEAILDEEFAAFRQRLEEQLGRMNAALARSRLEVLTGDEAKTLKKLYRQAVKALHPDLHPELTEQQLALFRQAVTAYENGDLASLRVIAELLPAPPDTEDGPGTLAALRQEASRLKDLLQSVKDDITAIKGRFPYTEKGFINDEARVAARRAELTALIDLYHRAAEQYKTRLQELLG